MRANVGVMKSRSKVQKRYKKGYLTEVVNPKGTKGEVYIAQGIKPGFSAVYTKSHRQLSGSSGKQSAEVYAIKLAKAGHKKVTFRD